MERMLVTQALDERDLLVKKICDKIDKARFCDVRMARETTVRGARIPEEEFKKEALASWQQIQDLIARFRRLDAAIVFSNATTFVDLSTGRVSVAGAIAMRSRLKGKGNYGGDADFESRLMRRMNRDFVEKRESVDQENEKVQASAEKMRLAILGREAKAKDDAPLAVVESYVKENAFLMSDPLDIVKKAEAFKESREQLLRELDTQIKVSNATTFVEF